MSRPTWILIFSLMPLLSSCGPSQEKKEIIAYMDEVLKGPERQVENYDFDPESDILSRIKAPMDDFLAYVQKADNREYTAYLPSEQELELIEASINLLPPLHQSIMKERVIEICFINDFLSSGWADWVLDKNGDIYCVLALARRTLESDMSTWLNAREQSCFFQDEPDVSLRIDIGTEYSGFLGILLHETTHVLDYIINVTPFVEPSTYYLAIYQKKQPADTTPFTEGVWEGIFTPHAAYNFALRDSITYYGFDNGPKLDVSAAREVYEQLATTPFVSLLASRNWAQDLAELVLFYHLTRKLNQPYAIHVVEAGELSHTYEPMDNPKVQERFSQME
ncbi:MAG: hypothetical protein JSW54_13770, partial [Fidelibacterota bacterium]